MSDWDYLQPEFYKFGSDSLALSSFFLKRNLKRNKDKKNILEVGGGCGVISLEILRKDKELTSFIIERNPLFETALKKNISDLELSNRCSYEMTSIEDYEGQSHFDAIIFNPPYFFSEDSRPASDLNRDQCRRISRHDLLSWFERAHSLLRSNGHIYFSFRDESFVSTLMENKWRLIDKQELDGCTLFQMRRV